jgi:hypothetical protein
MQLNLAALDEQTSEEFTDGGVLLGVPDNVDEFSNMVYMSMVADEAQLNTIIQNLLDSDPVTKCPNVWVETVLDQSIPTYNVYISASSGDGFVVTIHPTIPEMQPYGVVGIGAIPEGSNANIFMTLQYQPDGSQMPEKLEIQVVFSGSEIYKALVSWP